MGVEISIRVCNERRREGWKGGVYASKGEEKALGLSATKL